MVEAQKRPEVLDGVTFKSKLTCGNLFITVNFDSNKKPAEIFATLGKSGGCAYSQCEGIARLASLCLRSGIDVSLVVRQLKGISCHAMQKASCCDAIAKILEQALVVYEKKFKEEKDVH